MRRFPGRQLLTPRRALPARLSLPELPRWISWRTLVLAVVLAAAGAMGAYAFASSSSLFDVEEIAVSGVEGEAAREVQLALRSLRGTSLVRVDEERVRRLARRVPTVRAVRVERDFPGTLRVHVTPERAVAVVRSGTKAAWLVSSAGRVLAEVDMARPPAGKPRIWLPSGMEFDPGEYVRDHRVLIPARALGRLPDPFPMPIVVAAADESGVVLRLEGSRRLSLRLGEAVGLQLKLAVAAEVLERLEKDDRSRLDYVDVSVPDRPVAGCEQCRRPREGVTREPSELEGEAPADAATPAGPAADIGGDGAEVTEPAA